MICQILIRQITVRRLALGSPYSKPSTATAEDGLLHPTIRPCLAGLYGVSISCGTHPMQRGYRMLNPVVGSVAACTDSDRVRAPERCVIRISGDSTDRSGLVAVTVTEAHIFQRDSEAGNGMLLECRTHGNGIPRKTGSKRGYKGESQIPPGWSYCNPVFDAKLRVIVSAKLCGALMLCTLPDIAQAAALVTLAFPHGEGTLSLLI